MPTSKTDSVTPSRISCTVHFQKLGFVRVSTSSSGGGANLMTSNIAPRMRKQMRVEEAVQPSATKLSLR